MIVMKAWVQLNELLKNLQEKVTEVNELQKHRRFTFDEELVAVYHNWLWLKFSDLVVLDINLDIVLEKRF